MEETDKVMIGLPSPSFLKAKDWDIKRISGPHALKLPLEIIASDYGDLSDLSGVDDNTKFLLSSAVQKGDESGILLNLNLVTSALLITRKYPAMEDGHVFAISSAVVYPSSNEVVIIGNVLEIS